MELWMRNKIHFGALNKTDFPPLNSNLFSLSSSTLLSCCTVSRVINGHIGKNTKIIQVVDSVTMIHYRAIFCSAANNCQFAAVCCNLLQFAAICHNLTQFATICRHTLLNCRNVLQHRTVFVGLTLAPPFIVIENNSGPKMGSSHFDPSSPQIITFSSFFLAYLNEPIWGNSSIQKQMAYSKTEKRVTGKFVESFWKVCRFSHNKECFKAREYILPAFLPNKE
jgi:hypothetical protein